MSCNYATFSVCGTRPWQRVKSYNKPDRDGNSDKYLWKSRKKRIVGGTKSDFGEWPWQVSLGKKSDGENLEVPIKNIQQNLKNILLHFRKLQSN